MLKKMMVLLTGLAFLTLTTGVSLAATGKCTVTEIKDNIVTLDCGKDAAKLKTGDKVKVKTAKKKAIEGC
jgi:riboflavin synthase alpha subunit